MTNPLLPSAIESNEPGRKRIAVSVSGEIKEQRPSLAQTSFVWFLRAMAAIAMASGLTYWSQLIGIGGETLQRYELMPVLWRVPSVVLAVLLPCASMGLWMLTSWGIVLWTIACLIEISIYGVWATHYDSRPEVVMGHVVALAILLGFIVVIALERHRERLNEY